MERKIGEIFEYKGEWYQTVKSQGKCCSCDFMIDGHCIVDFSSNGSCFYCHRKDKENIIFKKLEKVEDPYAEGNSIVGERMCQKYRMYEKNFFLNERDLLFTSYGDIISIEIKQTKEDMEEKKQKLDKLVDDYMACRIQYAEFEKEIKALYDKEESEPTLKEFDLEAARSGKPVCTRDGRKARIICFDRKSETPITVLVTEINGIEAVYSYPNNGIWDSPENTNGCDLMMLPEKKEMWINIYNGTIGPVPGGCLYDTVKKAKDVAEGDENYVTTIKVSWEE